MRAEHAQQLLDNEHLTAMLDDREQKLLSEALRVDLRDPTACVAACAALQAHRKLSSDLRMTLSNDAIDAYNKDAASRIT